MPEPQPSTSPARRPAAESGNGGLEPLRFWPLLVIGLPIALALALWNHLLGSVYYAMAPNKVVLDFLDPNRQAALGRRLVTIRATRAEQAQTLPIGVLIGQSTVREGLDIDHFDAHTPDRLRWLNLGASGGSLLQLRYYAQPLLASDLGPAIVVVGLHSQWLAELAPQAEDQRVRLAAGRGLGAVLDLMWGWRERNTLRNLTTIALGAARGKLLRSAGLPLEHQLLPDRGLGFADDGKPPESPWRAPRKYLALHADDGHLGRMRDLGDSYGWFRPDSYPSDGSEADALRALLPRLETLAGRVVVVQMPEHSSLRDAIPPRATTILQAIVGAASRTDRITLIDHRHAIDDRLFYDAAHLNREGRAAYSSYLAQELVRRFELAAPAPALR